MSEVLFQEKAFFALAKKVSKSCKNLPSGNVVTLASEANVLAEYEDPRIAMVPLYAVKTAAL